MCTEDEDVAVMDVAVLVFLERIIERFWSSGFEKCVDFSELNELLWELE